MSTEINYCDRQCS